MTLARIRNFHKKRHELSPHRAACSAYRQTTTGYSRLKIRWPPRIGLGRLTACNAIGMGSVLYHVGVSNQTMIKKSVLEIAGHIAAAILSDDAWRCIGWGGRTKLGAFFKRLRPAWKNDLEDRIIQEFLAMNAAVHVDAGLLAEADMPQLILLFTDEQLKAESLGYDSPATAERLLTEAVKAYRVTPIYEWRNLIRTRMGIATIPDKRLKAEMWVGADRYGEVMKYWVLGKQGKL